MGFSLFFHTERERTHVKTHASCVHERRWAPTTRVKTRAPCVHERKGVPIVGASPFWISLSLFGLYFLLNLIQIRKRILSLPSWGVGVVLCDKIKEGIGVCVNTRSLSLGAASSISMPPSPFPSFFHFTPHIFLRLDLT